MRFWHAEVDFKIARHLYQKLTCCRRSSISFEWLCECFNLTEVRNPRSKARLIGFPFSLGFTGVCNDDVALILGLRAICKETIAVKSTEVYAISKRLISVQRGILIPMTTPVLTDLLNLLVESFFLLDIPCNLAHILKAAPKAVYGSD